MKPRVRFAPSPTGQLHLGGARTALSNFLFAKNQGGKFLVRIEDTDLERSKKEYIDQICDSIQWLGLNWDEKLVYQSENISSYKEYLNRLLISKKAYRCFASKEELDNIRQYSGSFHYTGIWRDREESEINKEIDNGTPFTIRLRTPQNGVTEFNDLIYGNISVSNIEIDDFIIARSDGSPVYNFTNVIDDKSMAITHVIRGEDHVPNTAKQILIYDALGCEKPQFAHLPMILGDDKRRLSKRHGATGVDEYRKMGYQPTALLNYLALLGWNPGTEEEIFNLNQLIDKFDLSKVQKKSAIFDYKKFKWISSRHLMMQDSLNLLESIREINPQWGMTADNIHCMKILELLKPRSNSLVGLMNQSEYFFNHNKEFDKKDLIKIWEEDTSQIILDLKMILESLGEWVSSILESEVKEFIEGTGFGFGKVMRPLRFALCGNLKGPSLFDIMELLGKEESLKRIDYAMNGFSDG